MPTEADTCRTYIVPNLHATGWDEMSALMASVLDKAFKGEL